METTHDTEGLILLVDDDAEVRAFIASSLRVLGYRICQAGSADEALAVFQKHSPEIELVLTDVVMPGLFGDQLAERLLEAKPTLKVILMSGNPVGSLETSMSLEPGYNFLQKPFLLQDLRDCVAQHLTRSAHT